MSGWDLFDDFITMKMMEADEQGTNSDDVFDESEEDDDLRAEENEALLEALQTELSDLQDELLTVEMNEPDDILSDTYIRWDARRDLLEEQISEVEAQICELEI